MFVIIFCLCLSSKGTESLVPIIDVKFDKYGVKYGCAGNQAIVFAEPAALTNRKEYEVFAQELSKLPVPDSLKLSDLDVTQ